jgi:dTDP-4-dehydrorhamnose reductase
MNNRSCIVIFGASGFLGQTLVAQLGQSYRVVGTFAQHPLPELIHFDLATMRPDALPVDWSNVEAAILAASIAEIDRCASDTTTTRRVNVDATHRLVDFLGDHGVRAVLLSTDYVYRGERNPSGAFNCYDENVAAEPITEYARQKVAVEEHLTSHHPDSLVLRLSKNVGVDPSARCMFTDWARDLRSGRSVRVASDQFFCSIWALDTARAVASLLEARRYGIYNVCDAEIRSRHGWCTLVCDAVGADRKLVQACSIDDFPFLERRPRDTTMSNQKLVEHTGFRFTPATDLAAMLAAAFSR